MDLGTDFWLGVSQAAPPVTRFAIIYGSVYVYRRTSSNSSNKRDFLELSLLYVSVLIFFLGWAWLDLVSEHVPEPYLDEVFHIPQAQVYCEGRYFDWDDKITTPPGLYGLSLVMNALSLFPCTVYHLRLSNTEITAYLGAAAVACKRLIDQQHHARLPTASSKSSLFYSITTGINVALFPVIFFFSGLYYTDIASTLIVLLAYIDHLSRTTGQGCVSFAWECLTFIIGISALFMRQTNIFWVVVYMGGLEIVYAIKSLEPTPVEVPRFTTLSEVVRFYLWRFSLGEVHDPSLSLSSPLDAVLCAVSMIVAAICNVGMIIKRCAWPHRFVMIAFVAFIAWNGGVVLGDKSNHVATIHLAQMLYIWPLFAFFSAPLLIPQLLDPLIRLVAPAPPTESHSSKPPQQQQSGALQLAKLVAQSKNLQTCATLLLAGLVAGCIAAFNTIVHPFTLADNRHYMFYIFRYTIRRAWWARFALVPAYVLAGWLCFRALQGPLPTSITSSTDKTNNKKKKGKDGKQQRRQQPSSATSSSPPLSTVLLLVLATALSLVTAPLVEPRYFILPWVFWRLQMPQPASLLPGSVVGSPSKLGAALPTLLETAWFLVINAATMAVFIMRPFHWWAEDGSIADGGRVQRFMW